MDAKSMLVLHKPSTTPEFLPCKILYGIPLSPSTVDRLAHVSSELGPGGLSLMVDHPSQLSCVEAIHNKSGNAPLAFMKVDMGYRRAGVIPGTPECLELVDKLASSAEKGHCVFRAIYAHAGHSYETREDWKALDYLAAEFKALEEVAAAVKSRCPGGPLTLSVGATPTTTSLQHPDLNGDQGGTGSSALDIVNGYLSKLKSAGYDLEVHAGVYPTLDLQQLATHARDRSLLSASSIGISIMCEVSSLYPRRGPNQTTEALINAGCLALGREPCADMGEEKGRHYSGWGILMPWGMANPVPGPDFPAVHGGWQVGKVSQEHGILRWCGAPSEEIALQYGQRVRIWPNHACVAGAGYDNYLVVDSRRQGREDEVVDVWPRWRGW